MKYPTLYTRTVARRRYQEQAPPDMLIWMSPARIYGGKYPMTTPNHQAWFKTLKNVPVFPGRFGSLYDSKEFMYEFVEFYNHEHRHTGIGLYMLANVHFGNTGTTTEQRSKNLATARFANPARFTTQEIMPKILNLPQQAWINQPKDDPAKETAT